jgi:hypothetical protein
MFIKQSGKFVWQDESRSAIAQDRIDNHFKYLQTCKIIEDATIGECYQQNSTYWNQTNINE